MIKSLMNTFDYIPFEVSLLVSGQFSNQFHPGNGDVARFKLIISGSLVTLNLLLFKIIALKIQHTCTMTCIIVLTCFSLIKGGQDWSRVYFNINFFPFIKSFCFYLNVLKSHVYCFTYYVPH